MIKKWLALLARYPRLRILLVIGVVIVVIIVVTHLLPSAPSAPKNLPPPSQVVTPQINPQQSSAVGVPLPPPTSKSNNFFSGLFGRPPAQAATTTAAKADQQPAPVKTAEQPSPEVVEREAMARYFAERQRMAAEAPHPALQNSGISPDQYQQAQALSQSMQSYINNSSHSWGLPALQTVQGDNGSGLPNAGALKGLLGGDKSVMIKAGDIEFAVLDTALSSDQPGTPVLAHIVTGKFNGARLMGSFSAEGEKLVVRFTMMSMPQWPHTIAINAYAIDAQTGHNALASNVDHHYLVRYGSLIAASFLQGFGNAYNTASSNSDTGCGGSPICISTYTPPPEPTARNASYQALGQIGTNLSAHFANNVNMPPTITLDQGTGIGILFMQDLNNPGFPV